MTYLIHNVTDYRNLEIFVIFKLCEWIDRQTERHTSHNTVQHSSLCHWPWV